MLPTGLSGGLDFLADRDPGQKQTAEKREEKGATRTAMLLDGRRDRASATRIAAQSLPLQTRPVG